MGGIYVAHRWGAYPEGKAREIKKKIKNLLQATFERVCSIGLRRRTVRQIPMDPKKEL